MEMLLLIISFFSAFFANADEEGLAAIEADFKDDKPFDFTSALRTLSTGIVRGTPDFVRTQGTVNVGRQTGLLKLPGDKRYADTTVLGTAKQYWPYLLGALALVMVLK